MTAIPESTLEKGEITQVFQFVKTVKSLKNFGFQVTGMIKGFFALDNLASNFLNRLIQDFLYIAYSKQSEDSWCARVSRPRNFAAL